MNGTLLLTLTLLLLPGAPVAMASPDAGQDRAVETFPIDGFLMLIPPREISDVDIDIRAAESNVARMQRAEQWANERRTAARGRIEEKAQAIDGMKARKRAARGREAEATSLDAQRKALEREKELLERRESLRDSEIDLGPRGRGVRVLDQARPRTGAGADPSPD